ncbi:integrase [Gossypium australe]|uniref:Integrase n=1 Tax=Gossypium australe TaxID=47621 RepID=A0A5B6VX80_9ROSI|nr:integrase [Gossypium australe]
MAQFLAELKAKLMFLQQICEAQKRYNDLQVKRVQCELTSDSEFQIGLNDCLIQSSYRNFFMNAHSGTMSIHLGMIKCITI